MQAESAKPLVRATLPNTPIKPSNSCRFSPLQGPQRMRVFHINMHRKWGGQPNRVLETALGLSRRGHHVVVSAPRGAMLIERARAAGLQTFDDLSLDRGIRPISLGRDVAALRRHFQSEGYDVIDTHGSQDTWAVRFALLGVSNPPAFIRTRHNVFPVAGHPLNRWLYAAIDHAITISPQVIPLLSRVIPPERCTAIYSAPDAERFAAAEGARDDVRAELGIGAGERVVGVVGRLAPEKGHRYLIDAAPAILAAHPQTRFVFVGTGRSRADLESRIASLGLADRFLLTGFRNDVPRLLRAFDLFVLCPVAGESLGTSILEAMTCRLPVVATDVGGVRESVIDQVTGRLVAAADSGALAGAVIELLSDREKAQRLAEAGNQRVAEHFTLEAIARQTEAVYLDVLARLGRAQPAAS